MPTVLNQNGVKVMIYTHDHLPPHVHCKIGSAEVIIEVESLLIRDSKRATAKDEQKALKVIKANQGFLAKQWQRINPQP